jgi:WD40 repeat protein
VDRVELAHLPGSGHGAWALDFSPDGRYLAARHTTNHLRIWDWARRQLLVETPVANHCYAVDFAPDERTLVFGRTDHTLTLYDLREGKTLHTVLLKQAPGTPHRLRYSPDGQKLAITFHQQKQLHVVDPASGELLAPPLKHPRLVSGNLTWSPDGRLLAALCDDFRIRLWETDTWQEWGVLEGHRWYVLGAAFAPEGDLLASRSDDGTTRLWHPGTGLQLVQLAGGHLARHFSTDGRRLIYRTATGGGAWDVITSQVLRHIPSGQPRGEEPYGITVSHADEHLLACAGENGVRLCDLAGGRVLGHLPIGGCYSVGFHPSDGSLVTGGTRGVYRWPIHRDAEADVLRVGPPELLVPLQAAWQPRATLSSDSQLLATLDGSQVLVRPANERSVRELPGGHAKAASVSLSPDGVWAATGTRHGHGVRVWNVRENRLVCDDLWPGAEDAVVGFSPEGRWLAAGTTDAYRLWNVGTWDEVWRLPRSVAYVPGPLAFSPDSKLLAVAHAPEVVRLLHPETGRQLATLTPPFPSRLVGLCFSRDSSRLVSLGETVQAWDLRQIRAELAALGLEGNWPIYAPAPLPEDHVRPLRVTVDLGDLTPQTGGRKTPP